MGPVFPKILVLGTPKWMVYKNGNSYEQMDDLGVAHPYFLETPK